MSMPLADLEQYLAVAAYIVVRHGDAYAPTLLRLEKEVESERQRLGHREHAQRILSDLMRKGIKGASAV